MSRGLNIMADVPIEECPSANARFVCTGTITTTTTTTTTTTNHNNNNNNDNKD